MTAEKKSKKDKELKQEKIDSGAADEEVKAPEVEAETELTVEQELENARAEIAQLQDKILRQQAEFQNYRKRSAKDMAAVRMASMFETVQPFLQVFDHFAMAVVAAEQSDNVEAIQTGLKMILDEYGKALDELGVQKFDAVGEEFNPELHEAVAHEASDKVDEGKVIKQWSCGYKIGDKLLRPAVVVVSSGAAKEDSGEDGK